MKKVLSILLAAAMLRHLPACSSPAKTETAAPAAEETAAEPAAAETAEETSEAEEAPATEEAKTSLDIVFIPKGVADYWSIVQAGFENAATELGMTPRVVYPSKEEAGVQIETVMDVINSKPDADRPCPCERRRACLRLPGDPEGRYPADHCRYRHPHGGLSPVVHDR